MSGEREHSKYSPSGMERRALCPGSDNLCANFPARVSDQYAVEGQKCHAIIEVALTDRKHRTVQAAKDDSIYCMEDFDADFYRGGQVMLDYVYGILDQNADAVMWLETYVNPPSEAAPNEAGGYCDVAIFIPSLRLLYVIDYKNGAHMKEVLNNPQPMQYAAGFLYGPESPVNQFDIDTVTLVIVQPHAFHTKGRVRELDVTPYEVFEYLEQMDNVIRIAQQPDAPLVPGDEQCFYCAANIDCPARTQRALAVINQQFKTVHDITAPGIPNPMEMSVEQIAYVCQMMPVLDRWKKDVLARRDALMQEGHRVPGFKLVEAHARRKWYGEEEVVAKKLAALIGCEPERVYEMKLIGITEAEGRVVDAWKSRATRGKKKDAAEEAKTAMAFLTLKESTGNLTIVPEEDGRPAIQRGADGPFKQITMIEPPLLGDAE